jgi:hypothetical protein
MSGAPKRKRGKPLTQDTGAKKKAESGMVENPIPRSEPKFSKRGKFLGYASIGQTSGMPQATHPTEKMLKQLLDTYSAEDNKVARALNLELDKRAKGAKTRAEVLRLAVEHASKGSSLNSFIAKRAKTGIRNVQKILQAARAAEVRKKA